MEHAINSPVIGEIQGGATLAGQSLSRQRISAQLDHWEDGAILQGSISISHTRCSPLSLKRSAASFLSTFEGTSRHVHLNEMILEIPFLLFRETAMYF